MKAKSAADVLTLGVAMLIVSCQWADAASVNTCDEAGLRTALSGGGTINFACDGTIALTNTLTITANTVLDGSGRNVTISGNGAVRVFQVTAGVSLSVTNIQIADGFVHGNGAGILNEGTLTLTDCSLTGNYLRGGAFYSGAAVHSPGRLTAVGCTFALNRAVPTNNIPVIGGAVGDAYGIGPPSGVHGAWAFTNCTFYSNSPDAIATSQEGAVDVVNCTFAANTNAVVNGKPGFILVPTVSLRNSVFVAGSGPNFVGRIIDAGHNLSSDVSGQFSHPFSLENIDPMLGPLGDNGGPTLTLAPLPGSAAIGGGNNAVCPLFDQRGVGRPVGLDCDIGSVESSSAAGPGILLISVATNAIVEADTNVIVSVSRAGGTSGAISVQYQALPVTATVGADFTATQGTLVFSDGERAKTFLLPLKEDTVVEEAETVDVVLANPTGGAALGRSTVQMTILNDDGDVNLSFTATNYSAFESAGSATITVARTGHSSEAVSVEFAALPGTALGSDFLSQSGVLTFAPGQTNASFTVSLINNFKAEPDETVKLQLFNPTGGALLGGITDASLTIRDDDRTNAVLTVCDEANLRQALAGGGVVRVACDGTITLSAGIGVTVDGGLDATDRQFRLSGGGTTAVLGVSTNARFSLKNVTVTDGINRTGGAIQNWGVLHLVSCLFSNNQTTSEINSDGGAIYSWGTLSVDGCTFVSNRCRPTAGLGSAIASGTGPYTAFAPGPLLITNSTFTGNVGSGHVIAYFGPAGSGLFNCTIATNGGGAPLAVFVQGAPMSLKNSIITGGIFGGTVTDAGNNIVSGSFGPSPHPTTQTNADAKLSPLGNHGGPTPTMVLLPGSPALGAGDNSVCPPTDQRGVPRPIGSISDVGAVESTAVGAGSPAFYFSRSDFAYPESAGMAIVTVLRNGDSASVGAVNLAVSSGTAVPGTDYIENSVTLLFAAGEVMKTAAVLLLDDVEAEPSETIRLVLTDSTTGQPLVPPAQATVTILDDDTVRTVGDCSESSLRAAMAQGGRVQFSCDGVIVLNSPITVGNSAVLDAIGHDVTLSGSNVVRLFDVTSQGRLTLLGLVLADGRAAGTNGNAGVPGGPGEGGAIANQGVLVATNCVFLRNTAMGGAGGSGATFQPPGPGGPAWGGSVFNAEEGILLAVDCAFVGNQARGGPRGSTTDGLATVAGGTAAGGAIFNSGGQVQLHQCLVLSNAATSAVGQRYGGQGVLDAAQGGGIFSSGGSMVLTGVKLSHNSSRATYFSGANGGGISQLAGELAVTNCHLNANKVEAGLAPGIGTPFGWPGAAALGGGIYLGSVSAAIESSTLSGGIALGGQALVFKPGGTGAGGGLFCGAGGEVQLNNCTVAGNLAIGGNASTEVVAAGGGICASNSSVSLTHVTIAANSAGLFSAPPVGLRLGGGVYVGGSIVSITNSIVANNLSGSNCFGAVVDGGYNLSSDGSCHFSAGGSLNNVDPILGPLADYGGLTPTIALLAGSPALDAAGVASCLPLDQRGIARPFGSGCDIGAFESSPPYTILGHVTGHVAPSSDIQITAGSTSNSVDGAGSFALHGFTPGSYLVVPSSPEAIFVLSNRLVNLGPDLVDVTFHAYRSNAFLIERVSTGVVRATFAGAASQSYGVEVSRNLSPWLPRSTNTTATSGLFEFYDTNSSLGESRLFRAVKP